jgi:hypothetical protein
MLFALNTKGVRGMDVLDSRRMRVARITSKLFQVLQQSLDCRQSVVNFWTGGIVKLKFGEQQLMGSRQVPERPCFSKFCMLITKYQSVTTS